MAGTMNLEVEQGATFHMPMQVKNPGNPATPMDLTGYTARMQMRRQKQADEALVDLTIGNGGILVLSAAQGQMAVTMTATQTAALPAGESYFYDLVITRPDGYAMRLLEGKITVDGGVTRND